MGPVQHYEAAASATCTVEPFCLVSVLQLFPTLESFFLAPVQLLPTADEPLEREAVGLLLQ
jgi:hypothetical protein